MLELGQREGAKYAQRVSRTSVHIAPKFDHFLTLKYPAGLRSKSLQRHFALGARTEATEKLTLEMICKRFLSLDRIDQRKQREKERSARPPPCSHSPARPRHGTTVG